jgi:hypothetical protein
MGYGGRRTAMVRRKVPPKKASSRPKIMGSRSSGW